MVAEKVMRIRPIVPVLVFYFTRHPSSTQKETQAYIEFQEPTFSHSLKVYLLCMPSLLAPSLSPSLWKITGSFSSITDAHSFNRTSRWRIQVLVLSTPGSGSAWSFTSVRIWATNLSEPKFSHWNIGVLSPSQSFVRLQQNHVFEAQGAVPAHHVCSTHAMVNRVIIAHVHSSWDLSLLHVTP